MSPDATRGDAARGDVARGGAARAAHEDAADVVRATRSAVRCTAERIAMSSTRGECVRRGNRLN